MAVFSANEIRTFLLSLFKHYVLKNEYDLHSVVFADLLNKTKPHYSEEHTMRIHTMRGPSVLHTTFPYYMYFT